MRRRKLAGTGWFWAMALPSSSVGSGTALCTGERRIRRSTGAPFSNRCQTSAPWAGWRESIHGEGFLPREQQGSADPRAPPLERLPRAPWSEAF